MMICLIVLVALFAIICSFPAAAECTDTNENCSFWASQGECQSNPGFMHSKCPLSCGTCVEMKEGDLALIQSVANYGKEQVVQGEHSSKTLDVIRNTIHYMQNDLQKLSPQIIAECTNRDELCSFWAALGECTNNPEFMSQECGPSCQNCGKPVVPPCPSLGTKAAIEPGGLYDMFERIVSNAPGNNTHIEIDHEMTNYTVQILSKPQEKVLDVSLEYGQHPWIISFDNFLTDEECDKLIELGYMVGYARSLDAGEVKADGSFEGITSDDWTSSGAFCSYSSNCRSDDVAQRIHDRIAKVTGIPVGNSEDLQILKYEVGNKYGLHHDFVDQQLVHQCGPRILTFFLYLNNVEEGGETAFPYLGNQVKPKRGTAVLWPNVLSSDPKQKDLKTAHEAKAVIKGRKYGVNSWLHMYEYIDLPCGFNPL